MRTGVISRNKNQNIKPRAHSRNARNRYAGTINITRILRLSQRVQIREPPNTRIIRQFSASLFWSMVWTVECPKRKKHCRANHVLAPRPINNVFLFPCSSCFGVTGSRNPWRYESFGCSVWGSISRTGSVISSRAVCVWSDRIRRVKLTAGTRVMAASTMPDCSTLPP